MDIDRLIAQLLDAHEQIDISFAIEHIVLRELGKLQENTTELWQRYANLMPNDGYKTCRCMVLRSHRRVESIDCPHDVFDPIVPQ